MANKQQPGPYDQYDDYQLLLRYLKICEDMWLHVDFVRWIVGWDVPIEKSQTMAEKIDKLEMECYIRGLMGPKGEESKLSIEERKQTVKLGMQSNQLSIGPEWHHLRDQMKEAPWGNPLTPKGKALRVWADPSLEGKYHDFIGYAKKEEIDKATTEIEIKYEALRLKSCEEDNALAVKMKEEK